MQPRSTSNVGAGGNGAGRSVAVSSAVQATFDFIVGVSNRELLRVDEVATRLGVSKAYVYDLLDSGELESHRRGLRGSTMLVTRRSVVAWLARTADYVPDDFLATLVELAMRLTQQQRAQLIARIAAGN